MKKAIMLSIQPKWCELIASGQKTIEVRKTHPQLETPFKCYIYCTNTRPFLVWGDVFRGDWETEFTHLAGYSRKEAERIWDVFNGKVMGEFVCDRIERFNIGSLRCDDIEKLACLSYKEMVGYFYKPNELDGKTVKMGYGWHISDLKIYDTPKEVSEFYSTAYQKNCKPCDALCEYYPNCELKKNRKPLTRTPQSWCYVEEVTE